MRPMALRSLAARVRTSAAPVHLRTPALLPSAAAVRHRLSPPPGSRKFFSTKQRGGSSREDAARKMVIDNAETLDDLVKNYERIKARVGFLEKGCSVLKWSLAFSVPLPLVYAIAQR